MKKYQLKAGAGKAIIEIPADFFPQEGFSGIHDDIHVRVVILDSLKKVVLVSLELTSLPGTEVDLLKEIVHSVTEATVENIWICATHSFSSPHFMPPFMLKDEEAVRKTKMFRSAIHNAVEKSCRIASDKLQDAVMGTDSGICNVNINRDVLTKKGWWIGSNFEAGSDKTLSVIRIDKADNTEDKADNTENNSEEVTIALIFNYNVQSAIMDGSSLEDGTKMITPDLAGKASDYIEKEYGKNITALFLIGAAGDQAPVKKAKFTFENQSGDLEEKDLKEKGYQFIEELGETLGKETIAVARRIKCTSIKGIVTGKTDFQCPGQVMPKNIHDIQPSFTYEYISEADKESGVEAIGIGDLVLLGTKPELCHNTARELKNASPFSHTLIATMVNGASKYMADEESYEKTTYEAMNSPFGKGSAEILTENAIALLNQMKNQIQEVL